MLVILFGGDFLQKLVINATGIIRLARWRPKSLIAYSSMIREVCVNDYICIAIAGSASVSVSNGDSISPVVVEE